MSTVITNVTVLIDTGKNYNLDVSNGDDYTVEVITGLPGDDGVDGVDGVSPTLVSGTNIDIVESPIGTFTVNNTLADATIPSNITQDTTHRFVSDSEKSTWNGKQDTLGFTPEDIANKQTDLTASSTKYPTVNAVVAGDSATLSAAQTYADGIVVGLLDDRGNYDASGNVYPSSGGSGVAGAVVKGDLWSISVAGSLGGASVGIGDVIRSLVDNPAQTISNWAILENNLGYVPEPAIAGGTIDQFWRGDKSWQGILSTVQNTLLTGYSIGANAAITALDSIKSAFEKMQGQMDGKQPRIIDVTTAQAVGTSTKTATVSGYTPTAGDWLLVVFTNGNTANALNLNINSTGALPIRVAGAQAGAGVMTLAAGAQVPMYFDGTSYNVTGSQVNTTYTGITTAEIDAGIGTTFRTISAARLRYAFDTLLATASASGTISSADKIKIDGMGSFTHGSNANGEWFKWFDAGGNIIRMTQTWSATTISGGTITVNLPVAFPTTNYRVPATGNTAGSSVVFGFPNMTGATDSTFTLWTRRIDTGVALNTSVNGVAEWIKV